MPRLPRTLPPRRARAEAGRGDAAARRGTQGAGAELHSGSVSSAVREAPGTDSSGRLHTNTTSPTTSGNPRADTLGAPPGITHAPFPPRTPRGHARLSAVTRVGSNTHLDLYPLRTHAKHPPLSQEAHIHICGPRAHAARDSHTHLPLTPITHSARTHECYARGPLPQPPAGSRRCLGAAPFPDSANKRLLLPARPKKGRLSGVSGGRGGPTLRPCPTWRRAARGSREPSVRRHPTSTPHTNKITAPNYTRASFHRLLQPRLPAYSLCPQLGPQASPLDPSFTPEPHLPSPRRSLPPRPWVPSTAPPDRHPLTLSTRLFPVSPISFVPQSFSSVPVSPPLLRLPCVPWTPSCFPPSSPPPHPLP